MPEPSEPSADNAPDNAPEDHVPGREGLASDLTPGTRTPFRPASFDPVSLRHIDWRATFPFTHVFRGFRLAAHPSKLLLALAGVLLLYVGGRTLDGIWSWTSNQAFPGEVDAFESFVADPANRGGSFDAIRRQARADAQEAYERLRAAAAYDRNTTRVEDITRDDVEAFIKRQRDAEVRRAQTAASRDERVRQTRTAHESAVELWELAKQVDGSGPFAVFYEYETTQFDSMLRSVVTASPRGMVRALWNGLLVGPLWGFSQHAVYFSIFFLWFLILAAVFGGAISRIAAVEVARDEKISFRSALRFSTGKFVSFISAPLIPILIIVVLAILVALPGLLANFAWGVGDFVMALISIAFVLALLAGFVITLVLIGLIGGFALMYPTIAAEGTDSFDAISRSFSYLYARPWRLGFLALAGLVYGAITYLFVRLFVWLVLVSSHAAAGLFIWRDAAGQHDVLEAIWPPPPTYSNLSYDIPFINLSPIQDFAAVILSFWVYLMIALVAAYAISLYYSISTIIYFLMRREVDATEMDDVYLDPHDEELGRYSDVPDADTEAPIEPVEPGAQARTE